jgi:hypothetical protein
MLNAEPAEAVHGNTMYRMVISNTQSQNVSDKAATIDSIAIFRLLM